MNQLFSNVNKKGDISNGINNVVALIRDYLYLYFTLIRLILFQQVEAPLLKIA